MSPSTPDPNSLTGIQHTMQLDSYTHSHPDNWRIPVTDWDKVRKDAYAAVEYAYPDEAAGIKAEIESWQDPSRFEGDYIKLVTIKDYLVAMRNKYPHDDRPAGRAVRAYVLWVQTPPEQRKNDLLIW